MQQAYEMTGACHRRPRRTREEVSEAPICAVAALFAEREAGHVTVRDITARADVNPTFVHRCFGSKKSLMHVAILRAQEGIASRIDEMQDVVESAASVVSATLQEKELIARLARGILDGAVDGALTANARRGDCSSVSRLR